MLNIKNKPLKTSNKSDHEQTVSVPSIFKMVGRKHVRVLD